MPEESDLEQQRGEKPVIAISSCLLGEPVRYDGQARPVNWIIDILSQHCVFQPICPELEAGFGVPRPPIRLQLSDAAAAVVLAGDPTIDVTEKLQAACSRLLAEIDHADGLILKARSPSCGWRTRRFGMKPVLNQARVQGYSPECVWRRDRDFR